VITEAEAGFFADWMPFLSPNQQHFPAYHAFHLFLLLATIFSLLIMAIFIIALQHVLCDDAVEILFVSHIVLFNLK